LSFSGNQYPSYASKVITTRGDIVRGSSTGARERLGLGSNTEVLTSDGTDIDWAAAGGAPTTTKGDISGYSTTAARIPISTNNFSLYGDSTEALGLKWAASPTSVLSATGDLLYASGANTLAKLTAGTQYFQLQQGASVPSWAASSASTLTTTGDTLYASGANTIARLAAGSTSGHVLTSNGSGAAPSWQAGGGDPPRSFWSAKWTGSFSGGDYRSNTANGFGDWATGSSFGCGNGIYCISSIFGADVTVIECAVIISSNGLASTNFSSPIGTVTVASGTGTFVTTGSSGKSAGGTGNWVVDAPAGSSMTATGSWTAFTLDET